LIALSVYLFVQTPPALPEETAGEAGSAPISIETVFRLVAAENDVARTLYTREIVGPGQAAGLAFREDWRDEGVEAGPLPALYLREASASLQKSQVTLGLFLGSDYPIATSNRFSGDQMARFEVIKETLEPEFFYAEDTELYTAMFPDFAAVQPCVDCHNAHPDSPKDDWQLNDVMGATTWSYPRETVTTAEMMGILAAVRQGFRDGYSAYVEKAAGFENPPEIGEQWPRDGYYLPSVDVFMAEFAGRASANSLDTIIQAVPVVQE
jgi:hypothetical protein